MTQQRDGREFRAVGTTMPMFEPVRDRFDEMLRQEVGHDAQLAVFWRDQLVLDLAGRTHLDRGAITGVFSATKGVAAIAFGILIRERQVQLDRPVVDYWPEFAPHGKDSITVRCLLSHQAGLIGIDGGLSMSELLDSEAAAQRLAQQRPVWRPGTAVGYHGLTIGIFMEELTRRVTGRDLASLYDEAVRSPIDAEFFLPLPAELEHLYRPVIDPALTAGHEAEPQTAQAPDGVAALMYNGLNADQLPPADLTPNDLAVRQSGNASIGGIGSARGLAQVYGAAIGLLGHQILDEETIATMSQQQAWGLDRVLDAQSCFGTVFMKPQTRMEFGSYKAFGHDGFGGAIGFADPTYEMSFGYIPVPNSSPPGADRRAIELSQLVRRCIKQANGPTS